MSCVNLPLWAPADPDNHAQAPGMTLQVDGRAIPAFRGDTVATALLRAGYTHFGRNIASGRTLAPACMMGVCFGCLCTIEGRPGSQACLEPARDNMRISIDVPPDADVS